MKTCKGKTIAEILIGHKYSVLRPPSPVLCTTLKKATGAGNLNVVDRMNALFRRSRTQKRGLVPHRIEAKSLCANKLRGRLHHRCSSVATRRERHPLSAYWKEGSPSQCPSLPELDNSCIPTREFSILRLTGCEPITVIFTISVERRGKFTPKTLCTPEGSLILLQQSFTRGSITIELKRISSTPSFHSLSASTTHLQLSSLRIALSERCSIEAIHHGSDGRRSLR